MGGVNRILWVLIGVMGCQVGRPPTQVPSVRLGKFQVAAMEPGLKDALQQGMSEALAAHGMLSTRGPEVSLVVRDASTRSVAAGGARQVYTAHLEIEVRVGAPQARSVVLTDERSYGLQAGDSLQGASARAAAFAELADALTTQAVTWIRYAPAPESK